MKLIGGTSLLAIDGEANLIGEEENFTAVDAMRGGYFVEYVKGKPRTILKNTLVQKGAEWFLRTMFRGESVLPATYYMGLTNATYTFDTATLASMAAGEPVGNGYGRVALNQNTTDWTVDEVNGVMRALSKTAVFTCSGAPWTVNWVRAFLCDASAGTSGNVIAVSGPAPAPRAVGVGFGPSLQYQFYLRG